MSGRSGNLLSFPRGFLTRHIKDDAESEDELDSDDEEFLYYSIAEGDPEGLARHLRDGLDPNATFNGMNQLGKSLLHLCCEKGQKQCAEVLLQAGVLANKRDKWYMTPLMSAACTERLDMIELLADFGANLEIGDMYEKTALHVTVDHETTECMEALLERGANIDAGDSLGRTPIWFAAHQDGRVKALECLLNYGARLDLKDIREKRIPIQAAIAHTKTDTLRYMQLLIEAGSSVNCVDEYGHTCIMTIMKKYKPDMYDIEEQHVAAIKMLLEAGHDINTTCESFTKGAWYQFHGSALNMAIEKDLFPFAELLLKLGANPDNYDDKSKSSAPLMVAAINNRLDIARLLLRANCKIGVTCTITERDQQCTLTPFKCAILKENWAFMELLLETGYDLKQEEYLWSDADVPSELILNLDQWERLIDHIQTPMPLLFIDRNVIRDSVRRPLEQNIDSLPLPTFLKDFLLLRTL